jgi:phage baseplate assembly protein W
MTGERFIGRGWRFPIKVNARGAIDWSDGPDRLRDAIWIVVKTAMGERVMNPEFGSGADGFVFQPNSAATRAELAQAVRKALVTWEPRIDLDSVRIDEVAGEASQVTVAIDYRIRSTNELFNLVLPFYLEEGVS